MPIETFDIWDQALLTDVINRPSPSAPGIGDESDLLGNKIAPLVPHAGRMAKIRVNELRPFGKGQFRAPDATPPLFKPPGETYREEIVELKLLDEMERIMEEHWMQLNSNDENIRRAAGRSIIDRGNILKLRNQRATEWMRWQAFNGSLVVTYDTGASIYIDYGLPAGHRPTAATLWSDVANADPIEDLAAWSAKLADDSGFPGRYVHMTSKTYDYLIRNAKIKNMINFYAAGASNVLRPRREDINNILTSFSQDLEIVIYDNGFRDEGTPTGPGHYGRSSLTRYLADGKVLMTTEYSLDGVRIADTLDGQVTVSRSYNEVDIRQGEQAEVMLDHISKTHFLRYASARIPRIIIPEAFLWATVAT